MFYVYVFGKGFFADRDIARTLGQEDFYNDITSAKKFETQYEAQDAIKAYLIKGLDRQGKD